MPLFPRPDLRSLASLLVAAPLAALAARPAAAGPPTPAIDLGGGEILLELKLPDGDGSYSAQNPDDNLEFMNLANCVCSDSEDSQFGIEFQLQNPPTDLPNEEVGIWLGVNCNSTDQDVQDDCLQLDGFGDLEEIRGVELRTMAVRDLVSKDRSCPEQENSRWVYAIVDEDGGGFSEGDYAKGLEIATDTRPPPEPTIDSIHGGENAVKVELTLPASTDDLWYFQALCLRDDGSTSPDDRFPRNDPRYLTAKTACGADDGTCVRATSVARVIESGGGVDGGVGADAGTGGADAGVGGDAGIGGDAGTPTSECSDSVPAGLADLDPDLICGEWAGTATTLSIDDLTNGVPYHVVLLVVDRSRNVTALDVGVATPAPVRDFWEDYKGLGGHAEGGCSAGQASFGGGLMLGLGLALWLGARRVRRRRRGGRGGPGAAAGGALLLVVALWPRGAAAQPWWESYGEPVQEEVGPALPNWGLEMKVGPYLPDVDSEFDLDGDEAGPLERVFGSGPFFISEITVDRYFLHAMGQLGVSATLGFLSRSANAFQVDADGEPVDNDENGKPDRSVGDTTTFRLFPASLGVVYRFTELDDRLRIPLVPYARAGLSYYYWWVTKPGGDTASVPTADCPDGGDCDGDPGRGGSLGWQATAGIALRAERVDPDAEAGLRELGIEHAGLVFEFTYAVVDGFGSDQKLSVGDATWFGGINFEF